MGRPRAKLSGHDVEGVLTSERLGDLPERPPAPNGARDLFEGYLRSYPSLINQFRCLDMKNAEAVQFGLLAAYGWMPTTLNVVPTPDEGVEANRARLLLLGAVVTDAVGATVDASGDRLANGLWIEPERLDALLDTLQNGGFEKLANGGTTGLSKFLHFAAPRVFPIWDSKVRVALGLSAHHRYGPALYAQYVRAVHDVLPKIASGDIAFPNVLLRPSQQYAPWLQADEPRAVELALFRAARRRLRLPAPRPSASGPASSRW